MKKYLFPTIVIVAILIGFFVGNGISSRANANNSSWRLLWDSPQSQSKVDQLLEMMNRQYVDPLDMDSITDIVMQEFVEKLDPHSSYIPKKDLELVNSELEGSFSGIGVQFSIQQDTVCIVAVISGGPCDGKGILPGDKIIEVNDTSFVGKTINNERVMHTLRGQKGTIVDLTVKHAGSDEPYHYSITRGDVPVHSVDIAYMIAPKIGFIRVNKFGETTYNEFIAGLAKLHKDGAEDFIIDLRGNPGGYMDRAIKMANEFLDQGDMIVYSQGRSYPYYEARANGLGRFRKNRVVVLIDTFSASASEIFSGAMQDNDRGTIIGCRSFGKGLVQQQYPLNDGSAVRLTVARYYTPSGRCIQKPYEMGKGEEYTKEMYDRFERGEIFEEDSMLHADSLIYHTKAGRVVYGGGGITPDIFVGRDTSLNTPWYNIAVNRAYTYQFAYQYTDRHRQQLQQLKTWQEMESYLLRQPLVPQFVKFCEDKGLEAKPAEVQKSTPLLIRLINSYIVRDMLGDEGFYPLYERDDEVTKRALKFLREE